MCLKSVGQSSQCPPNGQKTDAMHRSRVTRDPVRALRICHVIDRSIVAGLGVPAGMLSGRPIAGRPIRGGSAVAFARQVAMYLGHVGCGLTYTEAGRLYGRDRTTAAHACTVIEDHRDDPIFDRVIELLERCVRMGLCQIEPELAARLPKL